MILQFSPQPKGIGNAWQCGWCRCLRKRVFFSQSYYFYNKHHIKPTLVDSHPFVSANYSGQGASLFRPRSQVENLWTASSFFIAFTLCTFTKLDLNVGVVRRSDTVHSVMKTGGFIIFSGQMMEKSTNEKRQIRMSCVLYCFIFFPDSQKLIAHVECRCKTIFSSLFVL